MYYNFKCRECGEEFDEPRHYVEIHGLSHGPYESWSVCPCCGSCDYDDYYVVEEEELEAEEAALEDMEVIDACF